LDLAADGPGFAGSKRRIKPSYSTRKVRLPIIKSIS
jgi:hypothetical protein